MRGDVTVRSLEKLQHEAVIKGRHRLVTDEPRELGGNDTGPGPQMLLLGALGT
jgi:uncharacterized OsmC-like protein